MAREGLRSRKGGEEQVRRAHMQRTHLCDGASDCLLRCSSGAVVAAAQAVTGRYLETLFFTSPRRLLYYPI